MLHARPWSESSLLVDVFTREYGRFRLLAKGARRQKTGQRALLQPFQPLIISWTGKRSLGTLTGVELSRVTPRLSHRALASAYYMSELLFKFLHAHDAHENLFEAYDGAIQKLHNTEPEETVLREFECSLLSEIGYGMRLEHDASSLKPVRENSRYYYFPERGPIEVGINEAEAGFTVSGKTLHALANGRFTSLEVQQESKQLLRRLLTRQLKDREFKTRKVYAQILKTRAG